MTTLFSENRQKSVPKDFKECIEPDGVSLNLWIWEERLEKWGIFIFCLIIVFGIINTVFTGITTYLETDIPDSDPELATVFAVLTSIFTYALYAFLEYCVYHVIALLICSLASIVQNNNIIANLAIYNSKNYINDDSTDENFPYIFL